MKKFIKTLTFAFAFALTCTLGLPVFAQVGVYASTTTGTAFSEELNYLSVEDFESTCNVDAPYTIKEPKLHKDATDTDFDIKVYDPIGVEVEVDTTDGYKFTPKTIGRYKITYIVGEHSLDMYLNVKGVQCTETLTFKTNPDVVVPKTINPNNDGNDYEIKFPDAIVLDKDGNQIEIGGEKTIETCCYWDYEGTETFDEDRWDKGAKTLKVDKDLDDVTYTVKYQYKVDGVLHASNSIKVFADKDFKNDYEYGYEYDKDIPTTGEVGITKTLPGVNAYTLDKNKKLTTTPIAVKYDITAKNSEGDDVSVEKQTDGTFTFTPNNVGDFTIEYDIEDFFGNEPKVSTRVFTIGVDDTISPDPMVVLPYEVDGNGNFVSTNVGSDNFKYIQRENGKITSPVEAKEAISNYYVTGTDLWILPIWATDNANGQIDNNLTLKRYITKNHEHLYEEEADTANKVLLFNTTDSSLINKEKIGDDDVVLTIFIRGEEVGIKKKDVVVVNEPILDPDPEDYKVYYRATDKNGLEKEIKLNFTVGSEVSNPETLKPKVEFAKTTIIPENTRLGNTITFSEPTATNSPIDKRLTTYVKYSTSIDGLNWPDPISANTGDKLLTFDLDTLKYTFNFDEEKLFGKSQVKFIAYSRNDVGTIGETEKIVKIISAGDTDPTEILDVKYTGCSEDYKQGETVNLPTVVYGDDNAKGVNVKVVITHVETSETYKNYNKDYSYNSDNTEMTFTGNFVPENEGEYIVNYISTDSGNNITFISFKLNVSADPGTFFAGFSNLPSHIIKSNSNETMEYGDWIELPNPEVYLSTSALEVKEKYLKIGNNGDYDLEDGYIFTPKDTGIYTIQFFAIVVYADNSISGHSEDDPYDTLESEVYEITVKDTKGPEILNKEGLKNTLDEITNNGTMKKNSTISLPYWAAQDTFHDDVSLEVKISVKGNEVKKIDVVNENTFEKLEDINLYIDGKYTILYTWTDQNNQTTTFNYTIYVGDVKPPEIKVDEDIIVSSNFNIGEKIVIDLSKISVIDKVNGEDVELITKEDKNYKIKENCKINIYLKSTTNAGNTIKSTVKYDPDDLIFQFDLTEANADSYKLVVEATDASDHTKIYDDITFTITEDVNDGATAEEVLGVVLIIISVLLLGGVITYFVVSRRNLDKKY